jgi:DNA binding domain, excisionase family
MDRLLYSRREAARLLSISERSLTTLIFNERISIARVGRRTLIHKDELMRFARIDQPSFCL